MNQKKCPKCGEMNPPEAVMCWACYTPLTGAAATAATLPGATPAPGGKAIGTAAGTEEKEKTKVTPVQMGVIGFAVLIGIGFGAMQLMGGGPEPEDTPTTEAPKPNPGGGGGAAPPPNPQPGSSGPAPQAPTGSIAPVADVPYSMVASPSPQYVEGTMAILAREGNISPGRAAGLAAMARRQLTTPNRWKPLYIYVFADPQAAQQFSDYIATHGGSPLSAGDYAALHSVWARAIVRYSWNGSRERVDYPAQKPDSFWVRTGTR